MADYDLAIIGGGLNGASIARDAAGRGLRVILFEQGDLASAASSASSRLLHGDLLMLERRRLRRVRTQFAERELWLKNAPHLVRPMRFAIPAHPHERPSWLLRGGLLLYDRLASPTLLAPSAAIDVNHHPIGNVLKRPLGTAFEYSDCLVDDSRLVIANALDAAERGAVIRTGARCVRADRNDIWRLAVIDRGYRRIVTTRALANTAGAWVPAVAETILRLPPPRVNAMQAGQIIVRRLFETDNVYVFQSSDGTLIFASPFERDFTLVGSAVRAFKGDPAIVAMAASDVTYLCDAVNRYIREPLHPSDVIRTVSGVTMEPEGSGAEDGTMIFDHGRRKAPLITMLGGAVTTSRLRAERAVSQLTPFYPMSPRWTANAPLPGGNFDRLETRADAARERWPFLSEAQALRLASAYGSRLVDVLGDAKSRDDLGQAFGEELASLKTGLDHVLRRPRGLGGIHGDESPALPPATTQRTAVARRLSRNRSAASVAGEMGRSGDMAEELRIDAARGPVNGEPSSTGSAPSGRAGGAPRPLLQIEGVVKKFGTFRAVDRLSLDIKAGEFFALLGPSGCGKTTLLRMLAGFETPDEGRILLDGKDIAHVLPHQRPVNMMFQNYALFPHLSVRDNIAFGLKRAGMARADIKARVAEMVSLVKLEGLERRKPDQLSGGQRQRVALARSIARRPQVLLLDEPLAALDKKLRESTQAELMDLQQRLGMTFMIVTHDQDEAMTVANRIGVMDAGRLDQVATPRELYEAPNSRWVAQFVGDINLYDGQVASREHSRLTIATRELGTVVVTEPRNPPSKSVVSVAIRPEKVKLSRRGPASDAATAHVINRLEGVVTDVGYLGGLTSYGVKLESGAMLRSSMANTARIDADSYSLNQRVVAWFTPDDCVVLER